MKVTLTLQPGSIGLGFDGCCPVVVRKVAESSPYANVVVPHKMVVTGVVIPHVCQVHGLHMDAAAHAREHGIEVELPLIAALNPRTRVVGITLGAGNLASCQQFAAGLAKVIAEMETPPLLVVSSDMNHFATDEENRRLDELALTALETLDPSALYQTVVSNGISMCGVLPCVTVVETLRRLGKLTRAERVAYATSADVSHDTSRVVGYAGVLLQ